MQNIIWLASYPKSGNTWLRALLANYLLPDQGPVPINRLSQFCYSEATRRLFETVASGPVADLGVNGIAALRPRVHQLLSDSASGIAFVKTHCAITRVDDHDTVNPMVTAGAVYVVRNPLDVCVSLHHHFAIALDQAISGMNSPGGELASDDHQVHQPLGAWSDHVASWLDAPGLAPLVLRYEDMLADPPAGLRRVLSYLQAPIDEGRLSAAVAYSRLDRLQAQERETGFAERPAAAPAFFRRGQAGAWREELSEAQIARLCEDHAAMMRRLGYLDSRGALTV